MSHKSLFSDFESSKCQIVSALLFISGNFDYDYLFFIKESLNHFHFIWINAKGSLFLVGDKTPLWPPPPPLANNKCQTLFLRLLERTKGSLHLKKSVTFVTLRSDPPPYFPKSVMKNQKRKKNRAFKVQY